MERLLKKFDMGTQILFEHCLEIWRASLGIPIAGNNDTQENLSSTIVVPYSANQSNIFTNYSQPVSPINSNCSSSSSTSTNDKHFKLADVLNTSRGSLLVEFYIHNNHFNEKERNLLIQFIVQYFQENGLKMTLLQSHKIEKEIIERFPNEKLVSDILLLIELVTKF